MPPAQPACSRPVLKVKAWTDAKQPQNSLPIVLIKGRGGRRDACTSRSIATRRATSVRPTPPHHYPPSDTLRHDDFQVPHRPRAAPLSAHRAATLRRPRRRSVRGREERTPPARPSGGDGVDSDDELDEVALGVNVPSQLTGSAILGERDAAAVTASNAAEKLIHSA